MGYSEPYGERWLRYHELGELYLNDHLNWALSKQTAYGNYSKYRSKVENVEICVMKHLRSLILLEIWCLENNIKTHVCDFMDMIGYI